MAQPSDQALVERIQKLAKYVASNAAMEDHVRSKQCHGPEGADWAFLMGGEGAEFYAQEKLHAQVPIQRCTSLSADRTRADCITRTRPS